MPQLPTGMITVLCAPQGKISHLINHTSLFVCHTVSSLLQNTTLARSHLMSSFPFSGPVLEKRKRRHTIDVGEISSLSRTGNRGLHQELFLTVPTLTQQQIQGMQNQLTHRKRERPQSAYYERARQGFRFWTEDKPRPVTPSVKNTLGSKGSFLGLGVPRL